MRRKRRILFYSIFGAIVLAIFILLISANRIVKNKLENILQHDLPENMVGSYQDITVSTFTGSLSINNPVFKLKNKNSEEEHTFLEAKEIRVGYINYRKLLFDDELDIGKISIDGLFVKHYKHRVIKNDDKEASNLDMAVIIKKVKFTHASFEIYEGEQDSLEYAGSDIDFTIKEFEVNPESLKRKIPVKYESVYLEGNTFFIKTSPEEHITLENVIIDNQTISLNNIVYAVEKNQKEDADFEDYFDLNIPSLIIHEFDFDSFENEDVIIKSQGITIDSPDFVFYQKKKEEKKEPDKTDTKTDTISKSKFPFHIALDSLKIENGHVKLINILEDNKEELQLESSNLRIKLEELIVDANTVSEKIPFSHKTLFFNGSNLFVKAGDYENLTVENINIENNSVEIRELHFQTKYSRAELSRIIPVERDHYNISTPSLFIENFDYGFKNEEDFYANIDKLILTTPNVDIYRDKLVRDDNSFKPLYSRSIRELPFDLMVDSIQIKDAYVQYTERTHAENTGGIVSFKDLNAKISNVGNTYRAPEKTNILVTALFMDHAPLKANWSFDVQNTNDAFVFKGELSRFNVKEMNRFTINNIRTRVDGYISKTYFTIDGNNNRSRTDMKIDYKNLHVEILKENSKETRKFLTDAANLFLKAKDIGKKEGFRDGSGEADRHKTQSVFNQLWISVQSALKKTII